MSRDVQREGGGGLGFALTLVEGRGVLGLEGRALSPLGRIERLTMEIPELRFPFDLSGGAARFQHRRCRLRELVLSLGAEDLGAVVRRAPLEGFGLFEPSIELVNGLVRFSGRAAVGDRQAEFTALGAVRRGGGQGVRLSFFDVRLYGYLPIPAPLLVSALFAGLGAQREGAKETAGNGHGGGRPGGWIAAPRPLLRTVGSSDLELDALDLALFALLPAHGWRLPERDGVQLRPVEVEAGRLVLRFVPRQEEDEDSGPVTRMSSGIGSAEQWAYEEARVVHKDAEAALVAGDLRLALESYRRAVAVSPGSPFPTTRLLHLLLASPTTLAEADELASAVLARAPEFAPALLAKAVVAAEQGRAAEAAAAFTRVAGLAEAAEARVDEACARVAAAAQWLNARDAAAATAALEAAVRARPGHRGVLRVLTDRLAGEGRWNDVLKLLRREAAEEPDPARRASLQAESGLILLDRLGDRARARDRFEQAMRLDEDEPAAWEGLGRVQALEGEREAAAGSLERARRLYASRGLMRGQARAEVALAELDEAVGNDEAALVRLRRAAELDQEAVEPLRRAGDVSIRLERPAEAEAAFEGALARTRRLPERVLLYRRLAAVKAQGQRDPVAARLLLEQALRERPADLAVLDDLQALLVARREPEEMEAYLRQALAVTNDPDGRRALLARLAEVGRASRAAALVAEALGALAALGGLEGVAAALELASLAASGGDHEVMAQAAERLEALLGQVDAPELRLTRGELANALALLRERQGDDTASATWLRTALQADLPGEVAASAWQRLVAVMRRQGDLVGAAQVLVAFADDVRTADGDRARAARLLEAGRMLAQVPGTVHEALPLFERAVTLDPENDDAYTAFEAALEGLQDWERLAGALRRRLDARRGDAREVLHRLAALMMERLGRPEQGAETLQRLLDQDPNDRRALLGVAGHLWRTGSKQEAARHYQRLLDQSGEESGAAVKAWTAESHLRLGQWARVVGQMADAERHLDLALVGEPEAGAPIEVLQEVLEAFGRTDRLIALLGARRAGAATPTAARMAARALGGVLERVGRSEEAVALYRGMLEHNPDDVSVLLRLCEVHRREGLGGELTACLERLLALAEQAPDGVLVGEAGEVTDLEMIGLELASSWRENPDGTARAEALLRRLLERNPSSGEALQTLSEVLLARGELDEADAALARRVGVEEDPVTVAQLVTDRARLRLARPEGDAAAYALLRLPELEVLPTEGLLMRADLAERLGDLTDALQTLVQLRGLALADEDAVLASEAGRRLSEVALSPALDPVLGLTVFEAIFETQPQDAVAAETLYQLYGRLADDRARNRGWQGLVDRGAALGPTSRGRIHLALAEAAERDADLTVAEELYRRALALDSDAETRAAQLVGHARVLITLKEQDDAQADLEEALALVPDQAEALLLLGEMAYKNLDWEKARSAYDRLAKAPGGRSLLPPVLLAYRRAELAEMFGDETEAETAYREVAGLDPRHVEAREALVQIAIYREDLREAAMRLEELLKLYPGEAMHKISHARLQLGEIRAQLGDDEAARHQLELLLAEDPARAAPLEALVPVYGRLGRHREAADALARLARLYTDPRAKAEALFRQGEILRKELNEVDAADDAYLRSSDMDPTFVPTLQRLVHYYWRLGDFQNVAEVGQEFVNEATAAERTEEDTGLLVALGSLVDRKDLALARSALAGVPRQPDELALRLADFAARLGDRALSVADRALNLLLDQSEPGFTDKLAQALARLAGELPPRPGAGTVLQRMDKR